MAKRILNLLICLDQLLFCVATLGNSSPDETASAAAYRLFLQNRWQGKLFVPVIDLIFCLLEEGHCRKAFESERDGKHLPDFYQRAAKRLK